jgi:hypothetical protein
MTLNEYRKKHNLSYENLSRKLDFTASKMFRLCYNPSDIKLVDAVKIVSLTENEIQLEDLLSEAH